MVLWAHTSQFPKQYLDQFSRFAQITHVLNTHTHSDIQTMLRMTSVTICNASMQGGLKTIIYSTDRSMNLAVSDLLSCYPFV